MSQIATATRPRSGDALRWTADAVIAAAVAALQVLGAYGNALHHARLSVVLSGNHALHASGGLADVVGALQLALLLASGLALVARRRFPVTVLAVTCVMSVWCWATEKYIAPIFLSDVVAVFTVVIARRRRPALVALVACYLGYQWVPVLTGARRPPTLTGALLAAAGMALLLGLAELLRLRRERADALARGRAEQERRRASEERVRIARDLHDVVAHNISVINVQANVALHLMDRQPEHARAALTAIHQVSRQALEELRSVLGVLRDPGPNDWRAPGPGLDRLAELAATARAAGLAVRVEQDGERGALPAEVDLAAYRIVQEALTNSARHSGGGAATVRVSYRDDELVVQVDDDGAGGAGLDTAAPAGAQAGPREEAAAMGSGSGIAGMTERAHALGGTLRAGPRPGGGFRVRARLPLNGGRG